MKISFRAPGALMLSLSLCGGLLAATQAAPAKPAAKPAVKPVAKGKKPQTQRMFEAIKVTPEQKKKMLPVMRAARDQIKAIRADTKLSDADKKTKVKAARKASDGKLSAMLTADQRKKLDAFRKQIAVEKKAEAKAKTGKPK